MFQVQAEAFLSGSFIPHLSFSLLWQIGSLELKFQQNEIQVVCLTVAFAQKKKINPLMREAPRSGGSTV